LCAGHVSPQHQCIINFIYCTTYFLIFEIYGIYSAFFKRQWRGRPATVLYFWRLSAPLMKVVWVNWIMCLLLQNYFTSVAEVEKNKAKSTELVHTIPLHTHTWWNLISIYRHNFITYVYTMKYHFKYTIKLIYAILSFHGVVSS
jgi:hypothetical protein